ncbi:MAG: hypothetical protein CO113_10745 [Elusimicrobia bacterium CG_4_9_14_3_um_filter_62_55]|nr:MAG: hypothetical protein COR54_14070 [Elusimicrobia bacterium CG22_combo_CG10-13_8_21_14_all_63_91]PJA17235.1 MAG: hypothetical protein COX66_05270 [Elusimicrobia bacterium CG_4_10_14_0_2_um_filter_63_34]PJB25045.1 MAG: hypothetical protein CO113_10745 [Elusimicrobia bacterium CG_4_9_14_3_um_filter_62_55]
MAASRKQVQNFLTNFKKAAQQELSVIPRKINLEFLTQHGLTPKERKEVILGLTVKDYFKGPEGDERAPGPQDIWFFGVEYQYLEIYIKLQLVEEKEESTGTAIKHAKCISFHQAQWPMRYPYEGE